MLTRETGVFDSGYIIEMGHGLGKWSRLGMVGLVWALVFSTWTRFKNWIRTSIIRSVSIQGPKV